MQFGSDVVLAMAIRENVQKGWGDMHLGPETGINTATVQSFEGAILLLETVYLRAHRA